MLVSVYCQRDYPVECQHARREMAPQHVFKCRLLCPIMISRLHAGTKQTSNCSCWVWRIWLLAASCRTHRAARTRQVEPTRGELEESCFTTDTATRSQIDRLPRENIHTDTKNEFDVKRDECVEAVREIMEGCDKSGKKSLHCKKLCQYICSLPASGM